MLPCLCESHEARGRSARVSDSENSILVLAVPWPQVSEHLAPMVTAIPSVLAVTIHCARVAFAP